MNQLTGLLLGAFEDVDRACAGLDAKVAIEATNGSSSIAWTYGHAANQVDAWLNVRFQNRSPHPLLGSDHFRRGGDGTADKWDAIRAAVAEVREVALKYLRSVDDEAYATRIPYDGSFLQLHERGLNMNHAIMRISAHHYFHIGEIATIRSGMGHDAGDYPGPLSESI